MVASSRRPGVISRVASTAWASIIASAARPVRVSSDDNAHSSAALSSSGRGTASAERTRVSAASHCSAAVSVLTVLTVRADRSGSDGGVSTSARVARSAAARGVNGSSSATALSSPARATASPGRAPLSRCWDAGTPEPPVQGLLHGFRQPLRYPLPDELLLERQPVWRRREEVRGHRLIEHAQQGAGRLAQYLCDVLDPEGAPQEGCCLGEL